MPNYKELPTILCIGQDSRLLETRCDVLRTLSAYVFGISCHGLGRFSEARFDVAVLCHTLTLEQYLQCVASIGQMGGGTRIVRVLREGADDESRQEVAVHPHPAALLSGLATIIAAHSPILSGSV